MFLVRLLASMLILIDLAAAYYYASKDRAAWTIVYLFVCGLVFNVLQALK